MQVGGQHCCAWSCIIAWIQYKPKSQAGAGEVVKMPNRIEDQFLFVPNLPGALHEFFGLLMVMRSFTTGDLYLSASRGNSKDERKVAGKGFIPYLGLQQLSFSIIGLSPRL